MTKQKSMRATRTKAVPTQELDSVYVLKLVLYVIIGSLWLRFQSGGKDVFIPVPIGLVIGLIFAAHDHFKIDRKVEFAVLLVAMLVGFWSQVGLLVTF